MIRIHVWNLAEYNAGNLIGDWVDLDNCTDVEDLQDEVQIAIKGGEEWLIGDYECDVSGIEIAEYESLTTVWQLHEMLSEHDNSDALGAYIDVSDGNVEYAAENFEAAYCGGGWDSLEAFAESCAEDRGTPFVNHDGHPVSFDEVLAFISQSGFFRPQVRLADWEPDYSIKDGHVFHSV